jgi:aspartate racemase
MSQSITGSRFKLTPGIVGGLGPHAHIWLERRLLEIAAERFGAAGDRDYPPWIVVSIPQTPDRTAALLAGGPDPTPFLLDALTRLRAAGADFAAIACNTIHAFLPRLAEGGRLPLLVINVVSETADALVGLRNDLSVSSPTGRGDKNAVKVGLLATTGTCRSGLFSAEFARRGVELICPDDEQQESEVMAAIYGPPDAAGRRAGGIKGGAIDSAGATGRTPRQMLHLAADSLVGRGAEAIIVACSEISLAIRPGDLAVPVIDTMDVLAGAILDLACGRRELPK